MSALGAAALQRLMKLFLDESLFVSRLHQTAVWLRAARSPAVGLVWLTRRGLAHAVAFMLEMICQLHRNFSLPKWPEGLFVHKFLMGCLWYDFFFYFDPIYFGAVEFSDHLGSNWCILTSFQSFLCLS